VLTIDEVDGDYGTEALRPATQSGYRERVASACGPVALRQGVLPRSANKGAAPGDTVTARRAPLISGFQFLNKPRNLFSTREK
jgi:hypothetical protein